MDGGTSSSGGVDPNAPVDGSRIKNRTSTTTLITTASDGAQSTTIYKTPFLYDALRDEECAYVRAADGATRCLPTKLWKLAYGNFYTDSQCTHEILGATKDAQAACGGPQPAAAKYLAYTKPSADVCNPSGTSLQVVGPKLDPATPTWAKSGVTCYSYPLASSYDIYEYAQEIPASDFVSSMTVITTTSDSP